MALILLLPSWLLPNDIYRTLPVAIATALGLVSLAGMALRRSQRAVAIVAVVGAYGVVALLSNEELNALPSLGLLAAAAATLAIGSLASHPGERWSLARRTGPLAWAAPMVVWWMANVSLWVVGLEASGSLGYRAWLDGLSRHGEQTNDILAATGVPTVVLGVLAVGAHLALAGRRGGLLVVRLAVTATVAAAAVGALWSVHVPFV